MRDANNNSIFGGQYRPRLALNGNTTIELAEAIPHKGRESSVKSPFNNKKARADDKKAAMLARHENIKAQVLKNYNIKGMA